jgi:hypothetical protein
MRYLEWAWERLESIWRIFAPNLVVAAVAALVAIVVAAIVGARERAAGRPWMEPVARILAAGSAAVILATTLLRDALPSPPDVGRVILMPGEGGVRRGLEELFEFPPDSAVAALLVGNIALYVPLGFFAAIGWSGRSRRYALLGCWGLSLAVELGQLTGILGGGVAATDDLLLNAFGALVGWLLGGAVVSAAHRRRSASAAGAEMGATDRMPAWRSPRP